MRQEVVIMYSLLIPACHDKTFFHVSIIVSSQRENADTLLLLSWSTGSALLCFISTIKNLSCSSKFGYKMHLKSFLLACVPLLNTELHRLQALSSLCKICHAMSSVQAFWFWWLCIDGKGKHCDFVWHQRLLLDGMQRTLTLIPGELSMRAKWPLLVLV